MIETVIEALKIISKRKDVDVDGELKKMGFEKLENGNYHFNIYLCSLTKDLSSENKSFVMRNNDNFIKTYCWAKELDVLNPSVKEITLIKFLNNVVKCEEYDAKFIALSSLSWTRDRKFQDNEAIDFTIKAVKDAGYYYVKGDFVKNEKAAKLMYGLDKVWIEEYITREFSSEAAWSYIKKIAWHDPLYHNCLDKEHNIWYPRENKVNLTNEVVKTHLKYGGVIKMSLSKSFKCFVPIESENRDGKTFTKVQVEKDANGKIKSAWLEGVASNNQPDKVDDRMTSAFLQKMNDAAKGLTLFYEHKHDIEHTMGHIEESSTDGNNFKIKAKLEPMDVNPLVATVIEKINSGTKIGFSIYGTILEAQRVYDPILQKEIYEVSDGVLEEVSVTAWPCAYDTWATAIAKSLKDESEKKPDINGEMNKALAHTSKTFESEPAWSEIEKSALPRNAFADAGEAGKKSTWAIPHHYVQGGKKNEQGIYTTGKMYLHREGLKLACIEAEKCNASAAVKAHLEFHRKTLDLAVSGKAMIDMSESMDGLLIANEIMDKHSDKIINLVEDYKKELEALPKENIDITSKNKSITEITKKFIEKSVTLMANITEEYIGDSNG